MQVTIDRLTFGVKGLSRRHAPPLRASVMDAARGRREAGGGGYPSGGFGGITPGGLGVSLRGFGGIPPGVWGYPSGGFGGMPPNIVLRDQADGGRTSGPHYRGSERRQSASRWCEKKTAARVHTREAI